MDFQYINHEGQTIKVSDSPNDDYTLKHDWFNQGFGQEWEITPEIQNKKIMEQIRQIEAKQCRASREAILYNDKSRLEEYEQQIQALRNQLIK